MIQKQLFGKINGQEVYLFTLKSEGLEAEVIEYAASVRAVYVTGKDGIRRNVVLSMKTLAEYAVNEYSLGAVCGRHANRIEGAKVVIEGVTYNLEKNDGNNSLHSGSNGFHHRIFSGEIIGESVVFSLKSPHMDQGFPGNMDLKVIYSLTRENGLRIEYRAVSDRDTICNLTNHSYFNLEGEGNILDHELMMAADFYTPLAPGCIPDGEIRRVMGTPFDFTVSRRIGTFIDEGNVQVGEGYDHNFVLRGPADQPAAVVRAPRSGICMKVYTTMPGIQLFTASNLARYVSPDGKVSGKLSALCLETQYFPNGCKYAHFPQPLLKKGEVRVQSTEYRFSTK